MSRPLTARILLAESLRIAAILLLSYALGAFATLVGVVPALRPAGYVLQFVFVAVGSTLALLYVLARGVTLGSALPREAPTSVGAAPLLHGSSALMAPLALWFGLAALSTVLVPYDPFNAAVETIIVGCLLTGFSTVALYVIARATSLVAGDATFSGRIVED